MPRRKKKKIKSICLGCPNRYLCQDPCSPSACEKKTQEPKEIQLQERLEDALNLISTH